MNDEIPDSAWAYLESVTLYCQIGGCDWNTIIDWPDLEHRPPLDYVVHWNEEHAG